MCIALLMDRVLHPAHRGRRSALAASVRISAWLRPVWNQNCFQSVAELRKLLSDLKWLVVKLEERVRDLEDGAEVPPLNPSSSVPPQGERQFDRPPTTSDEGPRGNGRNGRSATGTECPCESWKGGRWFGRDFGEIGMELYEYLQAVPTALGDTVRQIIELTNCMAAASVGSDLLPLPLPYVPEGGEDTTQLRTRPHSAWMWLFVVTLNA